MSDAKPFATIWRTGCEIIDVGGVRLMGDAEHAAKINAAVSRERREAAAEALRDAADVMHETYGSNGEPPLDVNAASVWLLSRAEDIERGEA